MDANTSIWAYLKWLNIISIFVGIHKRKKNTKKKKKVPQLSFETWEASEIIGKFYLETEKHVM